MSYLRVLTLPPDHEPAIQVPKGGSSCATCIFFHKEKSSTAPFGTCGSEHFQRFYGTNAIPFPADEFCSDWYEPKASALHR